MEKRYFDQTIHDRFVSAPVDLETYFNEFGSFVSACSSEFEKKSMSQLSGLSTEEIRSMEVRTKQLFPSSAKDPNDVVPILGFRDNHVVEPTSEASASLRCLSSAGVVSLKKLRYSGEVNLEDVLIADKQKYERRTDLTPHAFYVVTLRVYMPVRHSKYLPFNRPKELQTSQEFFCLSSTGLDAVRDRIACPTDLQPVDGDLSEDLRRQVTRAIDVHRSALFYIGNEFYVDFRNSDNVDYSTPIRNWGLSEGYIFGERHLMERSLIADLKEIRLGYPYLYMHQGRCEHMIVFTDARLLSSRDPSDSTFYPLMSSFANLKSRYCFACHVRAARFIVVGNDRLPEEAAFMCTPCLEAFNYKNKRKVGRFKVYGYVDRTAML